MSYPEFDRNKYTVWALPNVMMWHWVLNPGLAVNELLLGMRIPKVMLIDRTSDQPLALRTYIPCPHCGTLHPGLLWGKGNGFGHWFGYLCPTCDQIIPCLQNWTSLAILTITYPLWFLPARLLKPRWLAWEKIRVQRKLGRLEDRVTSVKKINWIFRGMFVWGGLMWLAMSVVPFLYHHWRDKISVIDFRPVIYGLPLWLVGGLLWGLFMQFFMNKKGRKS